MLKRDNKNEDYFPSVGLKLTGACRLSCPFCCEPDRAQSVYQNANFFKIADILRANGTKRLCFTGGDPLLYPGVTDLLKYSKEAGFYNLLLTSDGNLLKEKYDEILPFIDAVRFSIHAIGSSHDEMVGQFNAFDAIEQMVSIMASARKPCFVATVVSNANIEHLGEIAEWCFKKGVRQYYLFGLMKSGRGKSFIDQIGEAPHADISEIVYGLRQKFSSSDMKIIYYDYRKKAECILVYGDGRVVIDPYPDHPSYQIAIGNLLNETVPEIVQKFMRDPENSEGYFSHWEKTQFE